MIIFVVEKRNNKEDELANVDLELKQSLFDEIEPLLGNAEAVKRLRKYVSRLRRETDNPMNMSQAELDKLIQKSIDGPAASEEKVDKLYSQW